MKEMSNVEKHQITSSEDYFESVIEVLQFVQGLEFEDAQNLIHNHLPDEKRVNNIISDEDDDPIYSTTNPPNELRKSTHALTNNAPHFQYIDKRGTGRKYARAEEGGPIDYKVLALMIVPEAFVSEVDEEDNPVRLSSAFVGALIQRIDELIDENRVVQEPPEPDPDPDPDPDPEPIIDPVEALFEAAWEVISDAGIDPRGVIIEYAEDLD